MLMALLLLILKRCGRPEESFGSMSSMSAARAEGARLFDALVTVVIVCRRFCGQFVKLRSFLLLRR